ncbi:MAG: hypothetical protein ACLS3U_12170 [Lachnospiraceae bacterium]
MAWQIFSSSVSLKVSPQPQLSQSEVGHAHANRHDVGLAMGTTVSIAIGANKRMMPLPPRNTVTLFLILSVCDFAVMRNPSDYQIMSYRKAVLHYLTLQSASAFLLSRHTTLSVPFSTVGDSKSQCISSLLPVWQTSL